MNLNDLRKYGIDIRPKICTKCQSEVFLTPKDFNPLIENCQQCGTTFHWLSLDLREDTEKIQEKNKKRKIVTTELDPQNLRDFIRSELNLVR